MNAFFMRLQPLKLNREIEKNLGPKFKIFKKKFFLFKLHDICDERTTKKTIQIEWIKKTLASCLAESYHLPMATLADQLDLIG